MKLCTLQWIRKEGDFDKIQQLTKTGQNFKLKLASVAQRIEQFPSKEKVGGSTPSGGAIKNMNKEIEKKIWPNYFDLVSSGKKKYELRLADFEVAEGDILILKEWDPTIKDYTGREIRKKVTQVGHLYINDEKFWSKEQIDKFGFHIISIE